MAEPFKNMHNKLFLERFAKDLIVVIPDFDALEFAHQVMDNEWENRELKERCKHITTVLKTFLPTEYKDAIAKILELLNYVGKLSVRIMECRLTSSERSLQRMRILTARISIGR